MNKFVQWVLNSAAGLFFFFFFLFLFFPYELIIKHYLDQVERQSDGSYRITVGEVDPSVIFRTVFNNFQVHKLDNGTSYLLANFPEVKMGIRYLPLLAGQLQTSFVATGKKGDMDGDVYLSKTEFRIKTDINNITLAEFPTLSSMIQVPLEGFIKGSINLTIMSDQWKKHKGEINLRLIEFKINAAKFSPYPGVDLDLPETILSDKNGGKMSASLNAGKFELKELSLPGEDLSLTLEGRMQLNNRFSLSRLNINGNFQLSEKLKAAFPLIMVIDNQKNENGTYPISVSGRVSKPSIQIGTFEVL